MILLLSLRLLLSGALPALALQAFNMEGLTKKITTGPTPHLPPMYSDDWKEVVSSMLCKDEEDRPSADDILRLPWLQVRVGGRWGSVVVEEGSPDEGLSDDREGKQMLSAAQAHGRYLRWQPVPVIAILQLHLGSFMHVLITSTQCCSCSPFEPVQPAIKRVEERYGAALAPGTSGRIRMQDLPAPIAKLAAQFKQAERCAAGAWQQGRTPAGGQPVLLLSKPLADP